MTSSSDRASPTLSAVPVPVPVAAPAPKLLVRLRDHLRTREDSIRTETAYVDWARRFILFHGKRHPRDMGGAEVEAFLTHLAVDRQVSASTQNQAKAALLYLYKQVLGVDLPWLDDVVQAKTLNRLPGGIDGDGGAGFVAAHAGHDRADCAVALWRGYALAGGAAAACEGCGVCAARDCDSGG